LCRTVNGVVSAVQRKAAARCIPSFTVTTCVTQRSCISTTKSDDGSIGFIGLGSMGYPMALNILMNYGNASTVSGSGSTKKIPRKVYLYDVDHERALELIKEFSASCQAGSLETVEAESVSDLSFNCSTIITMLPNTSHVFDIMTRTEGVFNSAKKGITSHITYCITSMRHML
jgi:NAD binding domain of 6-phosphogluconate dehydrogenase